MQFNFIVLVLVISLLHEVALSAPTLPAPLDKIIDINHPLISTPIFQSFLQRQIQESPALRLKYAQLRDTATSRLNTIESHPKPVVVSSNRNQPSVQNLLDSSFHNLPLYELSPSNKRTFDLISSEHTADLMDSVELAKAAMANLDALKNSHSKEISLFVEEKEVSGVVHHFSTADTAILNNQFWKNAYPSKDRKRTLARKLNVTYNAVDNWFSGNRANLTLGRKLRTDDPKDGYFTAGCPPGMQCNKPRTL